MTRRRNKDKEQKAACWVVIFSCQRHRMGKSWFEVMQLSRLPAKITQLPCIMTDLASFPRVDRDVSFTAPTKQINSDTDVAIFHRSVACQRILAFILLLNEVVKGKSANEQFQQSEPIIAIARILDLLNGYIDFIPPSTGPRRFGNVAFRLWMKKMEEVLLGCSGFVLIKDCAGIAESPFTSRKPHSTCRDHTLLHWRIRIRSALRLWDGS